MIYYFARLTFKIVINKLLIILSICSVAKLTKCEHVEIDQGRVIGKQEFSEEGRPYVAFRNIPFAEPPLESLRFEAPRPATAFDGGVLDATEEGPSCAQAALGYDEGIEDCLHLSVYTPKIPSKETKRSPPVLVWIHGGAFVSGSSREYSPHLMMDRDLVLVVPQYRLGLFGFFSTHSKHSGGNYGLLDQLMALRWINQNIAKFGGDPQRVTLGGDCAGGISALIHMLSPLSKGLFHRVLSFSGSPLSPWALHPRHNRLGLIIARHVSCPAYDLKILTECFRERSASKLLEFQKYALEARDLLVGNHNLAPSVQNPDYTNVSTLILEDDPLKLFLNGDYVEMPVLLSVTRDIGSYLLDMALYEFIFIQLEKDPNFLHKLVGILVKELDIWHFEEAEPKFLDFYLPNWNFKNLDEVVPELSQMLGDAAFNSPILSLAKILSRRVDTRLLRFEYDDGPKLYDLRHEDSNSWKPPIPKNLVSHGDELYFFLPNGRYNLTASHKRVARAMLDIIEDFVLGRDSLDKWPLFSATGLETTVISDKGLEHGHKFVDKKKEDFLQYIFEEQHKIILEKIYEERLDKRDWKREEL